ncbi:phosphate transport system permease protein [Parafrankia irregularis]|uniref:Phosphate transport system permease protein PstA n=1 Tax=Parafrankia irregularis TaxID=795642 RepID=A0A0S4QSB6_9ACTN|nr:MULTISPECIES: phosphate ABC transporter permease PstA [Parafrankia]MBE3204593.1 phosphate ABC transporter permease PstA [Parafrankia sp. CH37]CUU58445.1 phosphate transport system permease protein [Parafrankia irregularis]
MTATTMPAASAEHQSLNLRGQTLRTPVLGAIAVGAVALTALLYLVTSIHSRIQFVLIVLLLFSIGQTVASVLVEGGRRARDRLVTTLVYGSFLLALIPLVAVLVAVIERGAKRLDMDFLTHSMRGIGARDAGGGIYHAIIGTLEQVALASLMAVPFGLLVAVYLVEYGTGRVSRAISFFVDVLTGLPSIIAGLFVLGFWILALGQPFTGFAGSLALTILMVPVVVRSAEEMLKLVPDELREASFALGVARWRTILKIVVPTALPGIITGVMLAVARVAGETAPLLLTVFGDNSINMNPFDGEQSALPLYIYSQAGQPQQVAIDRAWAAALTLIIIIMLLNLIARFVASRTKVK